LIPERQVAEVDCATIASVFVLVFLAELGDKTQLVAFSMTATARSPWPIFFGASGALVLSSLLAALLGGAAGNAFGESMVIKIVSASLFVIFGLLMLFEREDPPVKKAFLDALLLESQGARLMTKILARYPHPDAVRISREISADEASHEALFRLLLKKKRFFADDINHDCGLPGLSAGLHIAKGLKRMPAREALAELIRIEQACGRFYAFLARHIAESHHDEAALGADLEGMVQEEARHASLLSTLLATDGSGKGVSK